jgi:hypothetical protein
VPVLRGTLCISRKEQITKLPNVPLIWRTFGYMGEDTLEEILFVTLQIEFQTTEASCVNMLKE